MDENLALLCLSVALKWWDEYPPSDAEYKDICQHYGIDPHNPKAVQIRSEYERELELYDRNY